jgi:hypothetical protein
VVQILVARNGRVGGRIVARASPTRSSERPYIGELSMTRPPASRKLRIAARAAS